ncbi:DinB family protein [Mycobacteroides saopaulense]|uniref:Serine/arginine repetitive matrix protein 1 n=1 Tax=Mycobacteroides saopaulense TaxID=1578165 RepID=A0A1S1JDX8_9MYCO|nr:DinB family protein [Mycobacteroides saopaulense]ALR11070.1 serine/arginine repetitive matrix protein 1 [Mycobacteroides saopaulense]OHT81356.1 serine/arginine repetitive matrix protein 1 [Mycobacteroides saopaulense]OHU13028.1 serine/arginine repetitive matrix protein 1 [Mycobacteroides saopaulense]ORB59805.1 serine/arginine repetitive matrix protein 1 [Mycobacteroides saopaulense]
MNVTGEIVDQIDWHWTSQLRPRFDGLTDDEYFWEPVRGCWSLRPRGTATTPLQGGSGDYVIEFAAPSPEPAPVTTIAWRLGHILVGVLGARIASHFGGPPVDYMTYDYPVTAADALDRLDLMYAAWRAGVLGKDEASLALPVGPAEGPWAEKPFLTLALHINRELLHHGAEIGLLRDLYAWQ